MFLKVENAERLSKKQGSEINKEEMKGKGECLWCENERARERENDREGVSVSLHTVCSL